MKKLFLIFFFLLSQKVYATTFYVSTTGLDSNSCMTSQTITTPKQSLSSAMTCPSAGDTINMRAGTYQTNPNIFATASVHSGTAGNVITLQSYPGDAPSLAILQAQAGFTSGNIIDARDGVHYWTVKNMILDCFNRATCLQVVFLDNVAASGADHGQTNWTFDNVEVKNGAFNGYQIGAGANTVTNSHIHDNGNNANMGYNLYVQGDHNLIDHNEIDHSGWFGVQLYSQNANFTNDTISRNLIHDSNLTHTSDGAGIIAIGNNHTIANNVVYNQLGGAGFYGIKVGGEGGTDGCHSCLIYNNTTSNNSTGIALMNLGTSNLVKNNINFGNGSDLILFYGTGDICDKNLSGGAGGSEGVVCTNNITSNPLFVGLPNFHLNMGSPAIGVGLNLSATFTTDLDGVIRTVPWDAGAYKFGTVINTTGGALCDVRPNINSIGVSCPYTGDDNTNNSAFIEYKLSSSSAWITSFAPINDRRALTNSITNPYYKQFRTSLVGLLENTSYDVRITYIDVDGISGLNPVSSTVTTISKTPTAGAGVCNATDNTTRDTCLAGSAGTINLASGTYNAFTITRSGSAGNYLYINCAAGAKVSSGSGNNSWNITINSNFVVVQGCELLASDYGGIASNGNHVYVKNNIIDNVGVLCANGNGYDAAGIRVAGNQSYILNNTVHSTALAASACTGGGGVYPPPIYNSPAIGIVWFNIIDLVIDGNIVDGAFRDAVSMDNAHDPVSNVDISNNTLSGYKDDGAESKGGINVRVWQNHITNSIVGYGNSCVALNSDNLQLIYGPMYAFRNDCKFTTVTSGGDAVFKLGGNGGTPIFIFHNSVDMTSTPDHYNFFDGNAGTTTAYNNIGKATIANAIGYGATGDIFDYNIYFTTNDWAYMFNGVNRNTPAILCMIEGQDCHSFNVDPLFTTFPQINVSSMAYHTGTSIAGFNGCNSGWPSLDSEIDRGAIQTTNTCTAPVSAPGITVGGFFLVQ